MHGRTEARPAHRPSRCRRWATARASATSPSARPVVREASPARRWVGTALPVPGHRPRAGYAVSSTSNTRSACQVLSRRAGPTGRRAEDPLNRPVRYVPGGLQPAGPPFLVYSTTRGDDALIRWRRPAGTTGRDAAVRAGPPTDGGQRAPASGVRAAREIE